MSTPIVFIDTETDGVHPDRKVWEVAMIRRDDGGQREISFFVEVYLKTADPFGLKVGRFYDRHPLGIAISSPLYREDVEGSVTISAYAQDIDLDVFSESEAAMLVASWTHGAHLVGAVPNFDAEVLAKLLRENRLTPAWHYHLVDVEALMVGALASEGRTPSLPWKSDDLSEAFGVTPPSDEDRHTALGDARWAMACYDAVMTR